MSQFDEISLGQFQIPRDEAQTPTGDISQEPPGPQGVPESGNLENDLSLPINA